MGHQSKVDDLKKYNWIQSQDYGPYLDFRKLAKLAIDSGFAPSSYKHLGPNAYGCALQAAWIRVRSRERWRRCVPDYTTKKLEALKTIRDLELALTIKDETWKIVNAITEKHLNNLKLI